MLRSGIPWEMLPQAWDGSGMTCWLRLRDSLRFTDRQRHELPSGQVVEPALIRQKAMAQQLCEHAQGLVGEILVDERFLSG